MNVKHNSYTAGFREAEDQVKQAAADMAAATESVASAQTEAMRTAIALRDWEYCRAQGLVLDEDPGLAR